MAYQLYRNTTLGHTLQESIDELIQVCVLEGSRSFVRPRNYQLELHLITSLSVDGDEVGNIES